MLCRRQERGPGQKLIAACTEEGAEGGRDGADPEDMLQADDPEGVTAVVLAIAGLDDISGSSPS